MATITGSNAADSLTGTALADAIVALAGGDQASGGGGNDHIYGGEGGDALTGGAGDDTLYGFGSSDAVAGSGDIRATLISSAFSRQVFATSPPGDPGRLFVVEQHTGRIRILDLATGQVSAIPFLDTPDAELGLAGEEGLLGLAFHPQYAANGRFFVFMNTAAGDIEVRSYRRSAADPDLADPASGDVILAIPHPNNSNHNGGWMAFGPDGFLYIAVGDGGEGTGSTNTSQDKNALLGKLLRIDVDGDAFPGDANRDYAPPADNPFVNTAGADEIWALGLRNPWRPSFDRATGDLYIADVGQGSREEVNFQPAASPGGVNYGWKVKEGALVYNDTIPGNPPATTPPLTDPLIDYPHVNGPGGGFSVTGGYVYRGSSPGLQGAYFFADYVTDQLWTFRVVNGQAVDFANRTSQLNAQGLTVDNISSFAEDGRGNLYILNISGKLFRIDPQVGAGDGADDIRGGDGNDFIFGGAAGDTWLSGELGADRVYGGSGNDRIDGGDGDDVWLGGDTEADYITGGNGDDRIDGGAGGDSWLGGGGGRDYITGGDGDDRIDGGEETGVGDSWLGGGAGRDTITGGGGDDRVDGGDETGAGDALGGGAGRDTMTGGLGDDRIDGGDGDDALCGGGGIDYITGGAGIDAINGGGGNDMVYGDAGNDTINGEAGDDNPLDGGAGDDMIDGGAGNDRILGGGDNDTLTGGAGLDIATGGAGADVFVFAFASDGGASEWIGDWAGGADTLRFDASNFGGGLAAGALAANRLVTGAAPAATQNFGQFLYRTTDGTLFWDSDGTGATAAAAILRLFDPNFSGHPAGLAAADFDIVA